MGPEVGAPGKCHGERKCHQSFDFPKTGILVSAGDWDIRGRHNIQTSQSNFAINRSHVMCDFLTPWQNLVSFKRFSLLISSYG